MIQPFRSNRGDWGYLPLQVQWELEELGFSTVGARDAVSSLLRYPMEAVSVTPATLLDVYEISVEKNHDVYDSFYVAVARTADADEFVTTDRNFEASCADEPFEYANPVPDEILWEFHSVGE